MEFNIDYVKCLINAKYYNECVYIVYILYIPTIQYTYKWLNIIIVTVTKLIYIFLSVNTLNIVDTSLYNSVPTRLKKKTN